MRPPDDTTGLSDKCRSGSFPESRKLSGAAVYWFDDTGRGACRVPESWRLLYKDGDAFKPVKTDASPGVELDTYNEIDFEPVETTALRIEVQLRPEFSGGVLEWKVR